MPEVRIVIETFVDDIRVEKSEDNNFQSAETSFYGHMRHYEKNEEQRIKDKLHSEEEE